MEIPRLCETLKQTVRAELAVTPEGPGRGEVLIQALYRFSITVVPALGAPKPARAYLEAQGAALDLVSFLALHLIQQGERRGVSVLVEIGEGCLDPLLKRKLSVYAQELLAKTGAPAPVAKGFRHWASVCVAGLLCLMGLGAVWWQQRHPATAVLPLMTAPPVPPPTAFETGPAATAPPAVRIPAAAASAQPVPEAPAPKPDAAAPLAAPVPPLPGTTPVRVVNSQVLVPVTLKHAGETLSVELVLDTGATRTALYDVIAGRLRIDPGSMRSSRAEVADGRVVSSRIARVDLITVGPFALAGFELELFAYGGSDPGHDGLLGMDFLGRHRYQLDLDNGVIHWL